MPIPYYVSSRFIKVGAKSSPRTFYPKLVLEPLLGSGAPVCLELTLCSGTVHRSDNFYGFWNVLGSGTLPGSPCLSLASMIDQNSRCQIGCPFLTTFLLVSLRLVPNLHRGPFTQNWFWNLFWVLERPFVWNFPYVLERFMVLIPFVGSGTKSKKLVKKPFFLPQTLNNTYKP